MDKVIFEPVTLQDLTEPQLALVGADYAGELLRFKNAILARAEINKNRDEVFQEGIAEMAATLPLKAIDVEHRAAEICGIFIDARALQGALSTDGLIFASRYPLIAAGVQQGEYQLSIEADAEFAECGVCGQKFPKGMAYCSHLLGRRVNGAVRRLRGLKAAGGAVTRTPAGTNTRFDPSQLVMVASVTQEGEQELDPGLLRAANVILAQAGVDLLQANPGATTVLASPVWAPMYYREPYPEWVNAFADKIASKVTAIQAAATPLKEEPPKPKGDGKADEDEVLKAQKEILARLAKVEEGQHSLTAALQPKPATEPPLGVQGLSWDQPTAPARSVGVAWG
jgi:hypothetical protein